MAVPWQKSHAPKKILAIRLQAMGDMVITLPYLQHLRNNLPPDTRLDLLTRKEVDEIPRSLQLFNHVYAIGGKRNFKKQLVYTVAMLPKLLLNNYDVVIDLQNNPISRLVRKTIRPGAWCAFDKYSPIAAGERNRLTIESLGLGPNAVDSRFILKNTTDTVGLLKQYGWNGSAIVVLNPAGAFENRNWPIEHYTGFAELWLQQYPQTQFLVLGVDRVAEKAAAFKKVLGERLIDLTNKTTAAQAFAIIQHVNFMLSEDSGLMHMAWVSGIPTLALFGSTRSDWSRPLGAHTAFLDSSDLPCGNCMLEICKFGDNHCITRYSPEVIFEKAISLYHRV